MIVTREACINYSKGTEVLKMNKVLAVGTEVICKGGMNKGKLGEVFNVTENGQMWVIFTDGTTRLYSATQNYLEVC